MSDGVVLYKPVGHEIKFQSVERVRELAAAAEARGDETRAVELRAIADALNELFRAAHLHAV